MLKITIDTNLINTKQQLPSMNTLERWEIEGKVKLIGTQRLKDETSSHPKASQKVKNMPNVSEPGVYGVSKWGGRIIQMVLVDHRLTNLQECYFPTKRTCHRFQRTTRMMLCT